MFWLPPLLVLLGALAVPEGTTKTCPVCPLLGNCIEKTCPPAQDACLLSQLQLANGTVIKNGSCVAPGDCRKDVYSLTYGPGLSLWIHTACCEDNCSSVTPQEARPRAQPNGLQCHYCPRNKLAQCDSLSVMNCTGNQTVCFTLSGTWHGGKGSLQEVSCMAGLHAVCTNQC
ncbi:phospholipase A2 inhibitor and Ly6/PLAUR domain-containing protein-like [Bos javanicus]|uniref:phospholipase A2 inhibitor and Ly6/PLAUR domain-containing protein-like n=1 Tax=Bos javanicus TaxID=9906 RepID=UPI002AA92841|nr:phospholipase A2 inhibitor and Ly6/PLAUR domain-containing protein-like [Bos javanicus]